MLKYSINKTLHYDQYRFFELVRCVNNYKNYLPWCVESKETNHRIEKLRKNDLTHFLREKNVLIDVNSLESDSVEINTFDGLLKVGFQVLDFSYSSKVSSIFPKLIISEVDGENSKIFENLKSVWKFEKLKNNVLSIDYNLEMKFKYGLYSQFTHLFMDLLGEKIVDSFIKEYEKMENYNNRIIKEVHNSEKTFSIEKSVEKIKYLDINNKILIKDFFSNLLLLKIATVEELDFSFKKMNESYSSIQKVVFLCELNQNNKNKFFLEKIWSEIKNDLN